MSRSALPIALAALLGVQALPLAGLLRPAAAGPAAADPLTAGLEQRWRELDQQLRLLDQLLPASAQPGSAQPGGSQDGPPAPLPAAAAPPPPLSLPGSAQLQAAGPQALSLQEAVALALRNSATLEAQRQEVAASLAELRASLGDYWPRLLAVGDAGVSGGGSSTTVLESSASWGLGPLYGPGGPFYSPSGGSVAQTSRTAGLAAGLQLDYALLDFARTPRVRAARARLERQRADYAAALRSLQLEVSEAYYRLQQADQLVRIRDADVRNDLVILAEALDLQKAGLVPRLDVLRRRAIEATSQEALIQALADRAVARRRLAVLLTLPAAITPTAADPIAIQPRWPLDLEQSLLAAYRGNPELEAVLATRRALAEERQQAVAALLPRLALFAGAGAAGARSSLGDPVVAGGGCCNASISPESRSGGWDWSIGLTLSWLLFDAGSSAARAEALSRREQAVAQGFAARRDAIRLRLEQAFFQHEASLARLASARRAVSASREAFRDVRLRYGMGLSSEVDLSLTQERLIQSLVQRLDATVAVNITYAQLLRELLPVPRDPGAPLQPQLQLGRDDHQRSIR
jgi:hypothetical protein